MLLITCPYCGPRGEEEFTNGREAHITRPAHPEDLSDAQWAHYTFLHNNQKGWIRERWYHAAGCRRWFNAIRHNVTSEWQSAYEPFADLPDLPSEQGVMTSPSDSPEAKIET